MRNLKLALRTLFKAPFVTTVAIVSLALGIGANAAIFSLFNEILLRPLPVPHPEQLVNLSSPGPKPGSQSCNNQGDCDETFSYLMFRDLERAQTVFTGIAAHREFGANLAARGQTSSSRGLLVSGSYFGVLGLQPTLGRLIGSVDDTAAGQAPVVVISHDFWRTRFGADPGVLNQPLIVNGIAMTMVGVAPNGFRGTAIGDPPDVFVPIAMRDLMEPGFKGLDNRRAYWAYLFARLKPGVSMAQAAAALNVPYHAVINDVEAPLQKGMSDQTLARFRTRTVLLTPGNRGQSTVSGEARAPLILLLGVAAFVLLIACANIANLLLARAAAREGEMAVRLSIGASRRQLIGQLLTESMLLAALGGLAGLLVARWTLDLILAMLPRDARIALDVPFDWTLVGIATMLALGTGLLFGVFPALHSTRPDLASSLKGQAGQPSGSRAAARFRVTLATTQIAMSMALLVAAGLFTRSLANISRVDLGLKPEHVVTFSLSPVLNGYTPQRSLELFERLEKELAGVPGVTAVTDSVVAALTGDSWGNSLSVEGFEAGPDTDTNSRTNEIGTSYFQALGIPLLAGRDFTTADRLEAPKVAIVNEAFLRKFNLGRDAVGRHVAQGSGSGTKLDTEIVGIVKDARYADVKKEVPPVYFRPYRQDEHLGFITFYARTAVNPDQLVASVPKIVAGLDPNLPVEHVQSFAAQIQENVFLDRFIMVLATSFASLATLLAAIGLYGVLAYSVAQRTREFGLRMALGAEPARVRRMVLRQVAKMTLVGGGIGLAAAIALGVSASSLLYQLQGYDPAVLAGAAAALTLVAFVAGFVPALRASKIEPMIALRYE